MSAEGWIFVVGFRIFDVGLLIVWLVWFLRMRDDGTDASDDGGGDSGGGGPPLDPPDPGGGGGLGLILPGSLRADRRLRDHTRPERPRRRRGGEPLHRPQPARVRRPHLPVPAP